MALGFCIGSSGPLSRRSALQQGTVYMGKASFTSKGPSVETGVSIGILQTLASDIIAACLTSGENKRRYEKKKKRVNLSCHLFNNLENVAVLRQLDFG